MLFIIFILSCLAGFSTRRGTICLVRAAQEIIDRKPLKTILFILEALTVSLAITVPAILFYPEHFYGAQSYQISFNLFVGALAYGFGSALNGGCALGTLNYIINGNVNFTGTFVGMGIGYYIYYKSDVLSVISMPLKSSHSENNITFLIAILILCWVIVIWRIIRILMSTNKELSRKFTYFLTSPVARDSIAIFCLGLTCGLLFLLLGHSWNHTKWIFSAGDILSSDNGNLSEFYTITVTTVGFISGIVIATILSKSFKLSSFSLLKYFQKIIGGVFISLGIIFIPGGNDTLILYDIPGLTLHAPVALIIIMFGIIISLLLAKIKV